MKNAVRAEHRETGEANPSPLRLRTAHPFGKVAAGNQSHPLRLRLAHPIGKVAAGNQSHPPPIAHSALHWKGCPKRSIPCPG